MNKYISLFLDDSMLREVYILAQNKQLRKAGWIQLI